MALLALTFALVMLYHGPSFAKWSESGEKVPVRWALKYRRVHVSFDVTNAFTERFRKRLSGGLTSRVVIDLSLRNDQKEEVFQSFRKCELRLDIWDDVLLLRIREESRVLRKTFIAIDDALQACGKVQNFSVGPQALLSGKGNHKLYLRLSLNPVSSELKQRTREFMSNPRGNTGGRPRAFFGAVSQLFTSGARSGGETFYFHSNVLSLPKRGTP